MKEEATCSSNDGQSFPSATTSCGPLTIQPESSVAHYHLEVDLSDMHLKNELQCNDSEEKASTAAAGVITPFSTTAFKMEVEETVLMNESHLDTQSRGKGGQDSFLAFNSLLSRMDDLLQNLPKQTRPCYYQTSLLLQCPVCIKGYKGGRSRLPFLLNHIKVQHSEMRSKLVTVVRQRYCLRKECNCFSCYMNRVSKHPKDRIQLFNNLSNYSKSAVLEHFQKQ